MGLASIGLIAAIVIVIAYNTFKILKEYERGVVFFLGRFQTVKGPGLIILIPGLQKMTKVDLRVVVMDVPTQDVISRDNVSVRVNAVIYFRIVDLTATKFKIYYIDMRASYDHTIDCSKNLILHPTHSYVAVKTFADPCSF